MTRRYTLCLALGTAIAFAVLFTTTRSGHSKAGRVSGKRVEDAHGLKLPASARNFQQRRVGRLFDHGILSLFEMDENEVQQFVVQLKIKSRSPPAKAGVGNPCLNGWNVWPENSATFVP